MLSPTSMATYNHVFSMTTHINRFIAEASVAKTNIILSLTNAVNTSPLEGIGEHVNVLA